MRFPEPPEGYELIAEFIEIEVQCVIPATKHESRFVVRGQSDPNICAHDNADLIAAVASGMLVVWEEAWDEGDQQSLTVVFRCLNAMQTITADSKDLPLQTLVDAARDLIREP